MSIQLDHGISVPDEELEWRFETTGGPGGQHANRAHTKVELRFDLAGSGSIPDEVKSRMLAALGSRVRNGIVTVTIEETRSQWRNRQIALRSLTGLLRDAMRPRARRRPTKPSRAARARRRRNKEARSRIKKLRRPPEPD